MNWVRTDWRRVSQPIRQLSLSSPVVETGAELLGSEPLRIVTPPSRWFYAAGFPLDEVSAGGKPSGPMVVRVTMSVQEGAVGIGVLAADRSTFLDERSVHAPADIIVDLLVEDAAAACMVMLRNHRPDGASRAQIENITLHRAERIASPFATAVVSRNFAAEPVPMDEGTSVFDDAVATALNQARLAHLDTLSLPLDGKSVLDIGCGVGAFADFYLDRGCRYVGIDGRAENIAEMRRRRPEAVCAVADVEVDDLSEFGRFDVVHCYGLLYHLESPIRALRALAAICDKVLLLETMVCDADDAVMMLVDESKTYNQALRGLGSRPSPAYIAMALNRIGFAHVYGVAIQPAHEDFQWTGTNSLKRRIGDHDLRRMFIASREQLDHPALVPLVV
ncbi:hypothetical protein CRT60_01310 [Azospirillum palustre]|uniref:Methyltransferase domain-containing protein n=1 Tax=Azospirillum palustre TaxID=2044885 RepID=A0A2B8BPZ2_9PROT|nr:class I SAM-dependent methyltransferase [Azospirillum palustre]PGH59297.1 hypothetical protein CRT60_01310 [Azospirillum palustre]